MIHVQPGSGSDVCGRQGDDEDSTDNDDDLRYPFGNLNEEQGPVGHDVIECAPDDIDGDLTPEDQGVFFLYDAACESTVAFFPAITPSGWLRSCGSHPSR